MTVGSVGESLAALQATLMKMIIKGVMDANHPAAVADAGIIILKKHRFVRIRSTGLWMKREW